MPYKDPKFDEFQTLENRVIHNPTGAIFTRYPRPSLSTDMHINYKNAGNVLPNGDDYDREAIRKMASILLFDDLSASAK